MSAVPDDKMSAVPDDKIPTIYLPVIRLNVYGADVEDVVAMTFRLLDPLPLVVGEHVAMVVESIERRVVSR